MARFLFIVNEHPNEAFAIPVARETAKLLRRQGHEVIIKKIPFKETALGQAVQSKGRADFGKTERKIKKLIEKFRAESKADETFCFHCTASDKKCWKAKKSETDFGIGRHLTENYYQIELKAKYRDFPDSLKAKIFWKPPMHSLLYDYLTRTSSHSETIKAGLFPEKFAKAIAPIVLKIAEGGFPSRQMQMLRFRYIKGRILKNQQRKRKL